MEVLGQLSCGVAHDFNNLLALIQGNAEQLRKSGDDGQLPLIDEILRACRSGQELTQRLRAFTRQEPLPPRIIDLSTLIDDVSVLITRCLSASIEFKKATPPGLWPILADPCQVESALLNLALNARCAMPRGGQLSIEARNVRLEASEVVETPDLDAGDYVMLVVSDTGTGMSAVVRERALEPFFTTRGPTEGTGLGLPMVRDLVTQSNGHLVLSSKEGEGTSVRIYFPRSGLASRPDVTPEDETLPSGKGETVLVIEDDTNVAEVVAIMLEELGYRAIEVTGTAAAEEIMNSREPVDLVLTDIVLPGGASGLKFAEGLRRSHPLLPVVLMSGQSTEAARDAGRLPAETMVLSKPFELPQLAVALRRALGNRS